MRGDDARKETASFSFRLPALPMCRRGSRFLEGDFSSGNLPGHSVRDREILEPKKMSSFLPATSKTLLSVCYLAVFL